MNIYKCGHCGTMVEGLKVVATPSCCGEPMQLLNPDESVGAKEKHVPVYTVEGNKVSVTVAEVIHPMTEEHLIEWIAIETTNGVQRKNLKAGGEPKAEFILVEGEELIAVYEYCNLHGLWRA